MTYDSFFVHNFNNISIVEKIIKKSNLPLYPWEISYCCTTEKEADAMDYSFMHFHCNSYSRMNLTESPFQTQLPICFTLYKQNNNENVKKIRRLRLKILVAWTVDGHLNSGLFNPKLQPRTFQPWKVRGWDVFQPPEHFIKTTSKGIPIHCRCKM